MEKINFNVPYLTGSEYTFIQDVIENGKFSGDGKFTKDVVSKITNLTKSGKTLLTTSCTHALEMSALLCDIKEGDEVIMSSFTFVSTANAFVLRGAKIVFVDIRPDTMNIDEKLIEDAITEKTKAIMAVHYAGVSCEMDTILEIADKHNLYVIEDAAQCVDAYYKGKHCGTLGEFGTLSFHETKNIHCGEGGALLVNDDKYYTRSEIIREKGTNRAMFIRGEVDKYSWVDIGSSYLPSELNAGFLIPQVDNARVVSRKRLDLWQLYFDQLKDLANISLPSIPDECEHNGHIFYIKCKDIQERQELIEYLKLKNIYSVFHYIPLHSSKAGINLGRFHGEDKFTSKESERLLRLPMHFELSPNDVMKVCETIFQYYL